VRIADEAVAPLFELQQEALRPRESHTGENAIEAGPAQMEVVNARAVADDKAVRSSSLQLRDFLPCIVSPIVKPGPTVPLTVFAGAAEPLPVAARAAAATAPSSKDRVRVILLMSFASFG
jgi:hypothetical protein